MRWLRLLCVIPALIGCDDESEDVSLDLRVRNPSADVAVFRPRDASLSGDLGGIDAMVVPPEADAGEAPDATAEPTPDAGLDPDAETAPDAAPDPDSAIAAPDMQAPPDAAVDPVSAECREALEALNFGWEDRDEGWTHQAVDGVDADWPLDGWRRGVPDSGPGNCAEGVGCWATHLNGNYVQCQRAELRSPAIDLGACAAQEIEVVFDHWYDFWAGDDGEQLWYDGGLFQAANAGEFFEVLDPTDAPGVVRINPNIGRFRCLEDDNFQVHEQPGYVLQSEGWVEARLPLGDLHRVDRFQVRFVYSSGVSHATFDALESQENLRPGWYVDHLRFVIAGE